MDDEEDIRYLYSEELRETGYEVIAADSGHELMEKIEEEKPDVVVLDINMADYNGLDLLQNIRNKYYDLPVALCTAFETFKEDIKSVAADYYVIKSHDLTELKNKIVMALRATTGIPKSKRQDPMAEGYSSDWSRRLKFCCIGHSGQTGRGT